jgi:uncharacterized HAD superfamily protein
MTTQNLKELLANPRGLLLAIDLDGTLCDGNFWDGEPTPRPKMIAKVWEWYKGGAHIIIYTGRQPKYYPITQSWLFKYEIPFHGIAMQMKPGAAVYIDDRGLNAEEI